jgi:transcriptional regulator with XRE-family HTH domain
MDKKLKNELFRVAVDYLFKEKKVGSQKELAEKIGITEPSLSRVMNGGRTVSDKTIHKMNEAFGGIFNMAYFRGEDPHCMLLEDLIYYKQHPEERLVFEKPKVISTQIPTTSDLSILIEKAVEKATAYADKTIATLENQVERYEKELDAKSEEIKRLQARIQELEAVTTIIRYDDPEKEYPFPIGTAEPGIEKDSVRV